MTDCRNAIPLSDFSFFPMTTLLFRHSRDFLFPFFLSFTGKLGCPSDCHAGVTVGLRSDE